MDDRQAAAIAIRTRRGLAPRWGSVMGGCLVAVLGITGCGKQAHRTPAIEDADIVRARYSATSVWDGQELHQEYEVIADGDRRVRISYVRGESLERTQGDWTVWDGRSLLDYEQAAEQPYHRYEDGEVETPPIFVYAERSQYLDSACPQARDLGTDTVLGRAAVRYACADSVILGIHDVPGGVHEMSLDQATGLLLKDSGSAHTVVATEIEMDPAVDAATFSTERPAGPAARAEDSAHQKIDDFRLPRVGGGEVALADFPPPLIIVAGGAAGIRTMVARLLPLTRGGDRPRVIGLLTAVPSADWTGSLLNPSDAASFADRASQAAGRFPVPVAVDIKGAAGYQITQAAGVEAGQTSPIAVGFIASDGVLAHVVTDAATDEELRDRIDTLG
jgi:hypothetical protein